MRLRWTRTQRIRPAARAGTRRAAARAPACPRPRSSCRPCARRLSLVSVMLGTTRTVTGADSSRPRVASPAKTARTWPLAGSVHARRPGAVGRAVGRRDLRPGRARRHVLDAERGAARARSRRRSAARRRPRRAARRSGSRRLTVIGRDGHGEAATARLRRAGQLRVERLARAGGRVAVAVAADALEGDRRPARVAVARAAAGLERDLAEHRHAVQRQLPADQPRQRLHRGRVERQVGERAEAGDAGRVAVVALRLRADDGGLDAARAALEDHAVAVDEEVVADVVPAVGVAVIARDAEDDRRPIPRARSRPR